MISFDCIKEFYGEDKDFGNIWHKVNSHEPFQDYHVHVSFLFKGQLLCKPNGSIRT